MQIYQFTLRIIHHPLKLSGLGLFNFGNDFLRKVRFYIFLYFIKYFHFYQITFFIFHSSVFHFIITISETLIVII